MKTLALFDFDGSLYKKDSLIEFTKFSRGSTIFYRKMLLLFPDLLGLKLTLLNNEKVKVKYTTAFFKGMKAEEFAAFGKAFALEMIDRHLDRKVFTHFLEHIASGDTTYIVSASFPEWIEPWSSQYRVKVIGTTMEIDSGQLTGRFASKNCYGREKVNRVQEIINLEDFDVIKVYGCGKGDREMLLLARP